MIHMIEVNHSMLNRKTLFIDLLRSWSFSLSHKIRMLKKIQQQKKEMKWNVTFWLFHDLTNKFLSYLSNASSKIWTRNRNVDFRIDQWWKCIQCVGSISFLTKRNHVNLLTIEDMGFSEKNSKDTVQVNCKGRNIGIGIEWRLQQRDRFKNSKIPISTEKSRSLNRTHAENDDFIGAHA